MNNNSVLALTQQYTQLCRYFFEAVDNHSSLDNLKTDNLNAAIMAFRDICLDAERNEAEDQRIFYSCMFDIFIWLGLKADEPAMANAQKDKIKESYSEIFKN